MYEILHRLMIEEIIRSGEAPEGISAVRYLKNKPEAIQHMTLAWDVFSVLRSIGFELIPDSPTTPERTFHLSRTCQLLADRIGQVHEPSVEVDNDLTVVPSGLVFA